MRVAYVVPGSGGTFYCENCVRDTGAVAALRERGHDVVMIPMYLPLFTDEPQITGPAPLFFISICFSESEVANAATKSNSHRIDENQRRVLRENLQQCIRSSSVPMFALARCNSFDETVTLGE